MYHGHKPPANAEAKTSPAKATRGGTIGLAERLENESLFLAGNTDTGIANLEMNPAHPALEVWAGWRPGEHPTRPSRHPDRSGGHANRPGGYLARVIGDF